MLDRTEYEELSRNVETPTQYAFLQLRVLLDLRDLLIGMRETLAGIEAAAWHMERHTDRIPRDRSRD